MKKNILIILLLYINITNSQTLVNGNYEYGVLPTNLNSEDIIEAYTSWKNTFTETCGDNRIRVTFDAPNQNQTVSEGIGYGMLIAAYAGDQDLLDGLWNYYTSFLNQNGVMHWRIQNCSTIIGQNGASDAELDAAMALIIASQRWGNTGAINYGEQASDLINTIKTHEIEAGTNVLKPGDMFGGSTITNISYFAPGYYRAYNAHTNDPSWNDVSSKSYEIINNNLSTTGAVHNLVSDWCTAEGSFSPLAINQYAFEGTRYSFDAARTPWRIALDYLWYGNLEALAYANKCIDFINSKNGINNIYPGYHLDGTPFITAYKDVTFTGAYAVAAMASTNQEFVNSAYTQVVNMTTDAYFGSTLRVLYLLTMSGNFFKPEQRSTLNNAVFNIEDKTLPYPNPVVDILNISFAKDTKNIIQIYNLNGNLISEKQYNNTNKATINVKNMSTGLYILSINNNLKYKFIKK